MVTIFWICIAILLYVLVGFPTWLAVRARLWTKPCLAEEITPSISVVIGAYNEQDVIAERIENLLSSDYPPEQLEIVVASDGSTDRTHEIVERYEQQNVRCLALPRRGKGQAINDAAPQAKGEILVFTDANTDFAKDALKSLVAPFADSNVGGVAGNQIYLRDKRVRRSARRQARCKHDKRYVHAPAKRVEPLVEQPVISHHVAVV